VSSLLNCRSTRSITRGRISPRRGDDDWHWYVVHVVEAPYSEARTWVGSRASLRVDADLRARLGASHTACHLMAFALNSAPAERWRKVPDVDSLGNPKFDAIATTSSRIEPDLSTDIYRLGKSLLNKGFTSAAPGFTSAAPADAINCCACWDSYRNRLAHTSCLREHPHQLGARIRLGLTRPCRRVQDYDLMSFGLLPGVRLVV
jgi:hypothetical protein